MPTYDYVCTAGHRYERQEPFGSPREHPCEQCGETASRAIVLPKVLFKGEGWRKAPATEAAASFDDVDFVDGPLDSGCCGG
jgi:putative FmdB family regulatory protein